MIATACRLSDLHLASCAIILLSIYLSKLPV